VATEQEHLALADKNERVIHFLRPEMNKFSDWVTTVAFYRALHLVDAVLARDKKEVYTHGDRARILRGTSRYQKIYQHYRPLYVASLVARYLQDADGSTYHTFSDFMPPELVERIILGYRLKEIEQSVGKLLQ